MPPSPLAPKLVIGPDEVHVFCARFDVNARDDAREARYAALLTDEETTSWRAFRFDDGKLEYLTTRALVRDVLTRCVPAIAPATWRFVRSEYGRPSVEEGLTGEAPRFNLSNTKGLVVCAVSRDEVGIDVEPGARGDKVLPIQETVFSPDELADLRALAEDAQPERAIHLWTLKESFIKARSMGLSLPLKRFSMRFGAGAGGEGVGIDIHPSIAVPGENWQFALHRLATDHVVALTMARGPTGRDKEVTFHDVIPLEDLASKADSEVP